MNKIDLKDLRKLCGLTQADVSEKLGMKQQQYSRYERNINRIPLDTFLKVLDICKLKIEFTKEK